MEPVNCKSAVLKMVAPKETYSGRVYIRPELTKLPTLYGAEFALLPSRYDPIRQTAIQFAKCRAWVIGLEIGGMGILVGCRSYLLYLVLTLFKKPGRMPKRLPALKWVEERDRPQALAVKAHSLES